MDSTNIQYDRAINACKDIFLKKTRDYGTSWRCLRIISITDQIYIKAKRIRTIQELKTQKVGDDITAEFKGIVNYGVIGLIQLTLENTEVDEIPADEVAVAFDHQINLVRSTMLDKNHDYGEAWREMSQESFVDLIIMKLSRIRQILANDGKTIISEGIDANFTDIVNYAIFALILIDEKKQGHSA
ncbi:MAG: DUF1599 domain-containing protein [bacterium]|jgi:hypothetical protein